MFDFEKNEKHFRIPKSASLKDIIEILNKMNLVVHLNDLDNKDWIYEHRDWFVEDV